MNNFIIGEIVFLIGLVGYISSSIWNKKTEFYKSTSSYLQGFSNGIMMGGVLLQVL